MSWGVRMQYKTIGEICTVVSGTTPKSDKAEYWGGNLIWITPAELKEGNAVIYDSVRHITKAAVKASALKPFPKGTVILSSRAPIGKVAIAGTQMYCNQGFKNLICSEVIYNGYLYYYLKAKTAYLNSLGRGATFREISKQIVEEIKIPVPSMQEQHRIADILFKIDALMGKRQQQAEKLDELVKARFVEMFGDLAAPNCKWKTIKIVEACENENDIKCGPFGTQLSKNEYQETGVAVWEIPQINSGFQMVPTHFLTAEKAEALRDYSIVPGDIAMSRKGNVGRCAVFPESLEAGIIHSDVLRIRVNHEIVSAIFLMYQLHFSEAVKHQIAIVSLGAIMAGINVTKLKKIRIHIPPLPLQNAFATFVHEVDREKEHIQRSAALLETLKRSLMQQYFG